jgi:hypothetical protein
MTAPCRLSAVAYCSDILYGELQFSPCISDTWVRRPSLRGSDTSRHLRRPNLTATVPCRDNAHGVLPCGDEQTAASLSESQVRGAAEAASQQMPTNESAKDIILASTAFLDIMHRPISYLGHTTFRTLDSVSFFRWNLLNWGPTDTASLYPN